MTDEDPWAEDKCEHGCWEPKVWGSIMDSAKEKIRELEDQLDIVRADSFSTVHAEHYHTFLTGRIQGLKDVLSFAEGARMGAPFAGAEPRRYA